MAITHQFEEINLMTDLELVSLILCVIILLLVNYNKLINMPYNQKVLYRPLLCLQYLRFES